ncbi:peptidoglycan-binding protein [Xanthomonas graminis]|uniref:peptidoglycan-binding protein n=1 Tax=Xanthomonas graminis TaxID=3390026 RepID=UPI0009445407
MCPSCDLRPNTYHTVEQFQREHGLQVGGVVGRNTHAALDQAVVQHATDDRGKNAVAVADADAAGQSQRAGGDDALGDRAL